MPFPATPAQRFGVRPFLAIYFACAIAFQMVGATPSWGPQSSLEAFSAGLFGMLALLALHLARRVRGLHAYFWWASAVTLVVLGLDEFFELHERVPNEDVASGDLLKVGLWLVSAGALAFVIRLERPEPSARTAFVLGFTMHSLYLIAEIGDGGFFRLPLHPRSIAFLEDLFQLAMLSSYLFAFASMCEVEDARGEASEPEDDYSQAA